MPSPYTTPSSTPLAQQHHEVGGVFVVGRDEVRDAVAVEVPNTDRPRADRKRDELRARNTPVSVAVEHLREHARR